MRCLLTLSLYLLFPQPHTSILFLLLFLFHITYIHRPCIYCYISFLVFLYISDELLNPFWNGINTRTFLTRVMYYMDIHEIDSSMHTFISQGNYIGFLLSCISPPRSLYSFISAIIKATYYPYLSSVE